jgi:hypothetical protein
MQSQSLKELYEHVAPLAPEVQPEPPLRAPDRPIGFMDDRFGIKRPSAGRRMVSAIIRFCVVLLIGVGATLAWQSRGDEAKALIGIWLPAVGRLLPPATSAQNTTLPQSAPDTQISAPAAALTSSEIMQQLEPMARDLAGARRSLEQLATRQEQIAQSVLALQTFEQDTKQRLASLPQSRPVPLPPRKPPQAAVQSSAMQAPSAPPAPPSSQQPLPLR